MERKPPSWLIRLWRGSDAELGDVLEEYAQGAGLVWLVRQWISSHRPPIQTPLDRRTLLLSNLWLDIRYTARGLRNNPGFASVAILAIALGIGINTGIFSVLNGFALREIPVPASAELSSIHRVLEGVPDRSTHGSGTMVSTQEYRLFRDQSRTLSSLMGYAPFVEVTLGGEQLRRINGNLVTCGYFHTLKLEPAAGTLFTDSNCSDETASPVVVLSHDLWRNSFGSDPAVIGRSVILNRQSFQIIGVAPEGFRGVEILPALYFAPITTQQMLRADANYFGDSRVSWLQLIGRRKPGISDTAVRAELGVLEAQLDRQQPGRRSTILLGRATAFSMPRERMGILAVSSIIMGAFGLVLLIACANVANLLLARVAGRSRESVVRLAIGATRWRLVQQQLVESLLIALAGGLLGAAFATATFRSLVTMVLTTLPEQMPAMQIDASPDLSVFGFAFALSLITSLGFGLAPALQAAKTDLTSGMKQDSTGDGRRTTGLLRRALVAVQVAICMLLLTVTGLLMRGLHSAQTIDPGFEYRSVAQVSYDMRSAGFNEESARQFQTAMLETVRTIPGVDAVAFTEMPPLSMGSHTEMFAPDGMAPRQVNVNPVSPEYFGLIGTPVVLGSSFTGREPEGSDAVIVTESTARLFWPGRNPVGQVLQHVVGPGPRFRPMNVVGVVRDAQLTRVGSVEDPYLYVPASTATPLREQLLIRTRVDLNEISTAIRERAQKLDPAMVVKVTPLEENLALWRTLARLSASLSGSLSGLGLLLASIGVYGVVSYAVSKRLREVGIRMALGASAAEVRSMILKQTMRPVFAGATVGLALAAGVARVLQSLLFGVSAYDPVAFVGAPLFLITVAVTASMVPIRRAMNADPMTALRYE